MDLEHEDPGAGPDGVGELDVAWERFERALAEYLRGLRDPHEQDRLALLPPGWHDRDRRSPQLVFTGIDHGRRVRGELTNNALLHPEHRLGEEASRTLASLGWKQQPTPGAPWA